MRGLSVDGDYRITLSAALPLFIAGKGLFLCGNARLATGPPVVSDADG
jgi:hypothetical protein